MKFISFSCVFIGKIDEIHILINEITNRETTEFFKISRDTSRTTFEQGSRELNLSANSIEKYNQLPSKFGLF